VLRIIDDIELLLNINWGIEHVLVVGPETANVSSWEKSTSASCIGGEMRVYWLPTRQGIRQNWLGCMCFWAEKSIE